MKFYIDVNTVNDRIEIRSERGKFDYCSLSDLKEIGRIVIDAYYDEAIKEGFEKSDEV